MKQKVFDLRAYTKIIPVPAPDINREQFLAYERTKLSGKTNMLDIEKACKLSGLTPGELKSIIQNYQTLNYKFTK